MISWRPYLLDCPELSMANKLVYLAPLLLCSLACAANDDDGGGIYTNSGTAGTLTNGTNTTLGGTEGDGDGDPGDGDADPGDGDGDGGPKLDVLGSGDNSMSTAGDAGDGDGCQKVDFLFVIDNSGSMLEEQDNLAASFPSFINTISSTLDQAQDYHIMVIDTDEWVYAGCPLLCAFPLPGVCVGFECGVTQPEQCEDILGAGVTYPKGANASNMDCNFANGMRFMTDAEPSLVSTFQCAARVGTDSTNDPERPMEAMAAAVSGQGAVGGCNTGFLRDDAILVVTFVTDENDDAGDGSAGTVDTWRQALIDAKNGDESAIVILGLFGDGDLPNAICGGLDSGGAEIAPRLRSFLDSWGDHGFFGSICANDYDDFFQDAVDIIDTTCDEFMPPG
jgi:hypothetical protein